METINATVDIKGTPAKIFEALTTTAGHRGWWTSDCEVGRKVGDEAVFRFNPMAGGPGVMEVRFRVDALAANEAAEFVCIGQQNNPEWLDTRLAFRLRQAAAGHTTVELAHSGFAAKTKTYEACVGGWSHFTQSLKQYVETGTGTPHVR